MPSKRRFGFEFFWVFFIFQFLVLFLFFLTIKLRVHSQTLPQYQLGLNISTYVTISFVHTSKTVHFLLLGYLPLICRLIFSPNRLLHLFLQDIAMPLAFLSLYSNSFFSFSPFFLFSFTSTSPT